jgi:chromosome segregation ATPase
MRWFVLLAFAVFFTASGLAQAKAADSAVAGSAGTVRSSPAYAELLLQKTELESALESLLVDYTEEYPKIKGLRVELRLLQTEMDRLLAVKPESSSRLTLALGKLMLRKVELETELETLRAQYKDDHPDVKKAKRKVEVFESAIKEILG